MTIRVYRDIAADDTELLSIRQDLGGGTITDIVEMPIPEVPAFLAEVERVAGLTGPETRPRAVVTWTAEAMPGMFPKHWRLHQEGHVEDRPLVVSGSDAQAMHLLEALNAYERPALHPVAECAEVGAAEVRS